MNFVRYLLLYITSTVILVAQDVAFEFLVFDKTKTEKIDSNTIYNVEITTFDFQGPRFHFFQSGTVMGLKLDQHTYTKEQFSGNLPLEDWESFQVEVRKLPLEELTKNKEGATTGKLILDGREYRITAGPDSKTRKRWRQFLDAIVRKNPPDWSLGKSSHTVEGEGVKPLDVTIPEIVKEPAKYDGKRVRFRAFYHSELECSHFVASPEAAQDFQNGIWYQSDSTFTNRDEIICENDTMVTVEGTFSNQPGTRGHMGTSPGGITMVTSIKPLPSPENAE